MAELPPPPWVIRWELEHADDYRRPTLAADIAQAEQDEHEEQRRRLDADIAAYDLDYQIRTGKTLR